MLVWRGRDLNEWWVAVRGALDGGGASPRGPGS